MPREARRPLLHLKLAIPVGGAQSCGAQSCDFGSFSPFGLNALASRSLRSETSPWPMRSYHSAPAQIHGGIAINAKHFYRTEVDLIINVRGGAGAVNRIKHADHTGRA